MKAIAVALTVSLLAVPGPAQEPPSPTPAPEPETTPPPQEPAPPKEPPPERPSLKPKDLWRDVKVEAKRYLADSWAIVTSPLHWDGTDWQRFGGVVVVVGGLMLVDDEIDIEFQENRSRFTDRVSDATTDFGGSWSSNLGFALLGSGYVLRSWEIRETGREVLEATFMTHVLSKYVFKPAFGRERPFESDGRTRFHLGSSTYDSFPSGHATQAFALASVVAARQKGWIVPALAYTAAAVVALDRVNDRVHFASDVATGAALGTAVGRFIVHRHRQAQGNAPTRPVNVGLAPIPDGVALRIVY